MTDQEKNEAVARRLGFGEWIDQSVLNGGNLGWGPKDYCHSIEAAFDICGWLVKNKYSYTLSYVTLFGKIYSFVIHKIVDQVASEQADTAPMAIVDAFLKLP